MKILLWHGYLLGGTGSNVYTRPLAREWSAAGHDVTVVCQERAPGALRPRRRAQVVRPELGGLLPVFVLDRYEGLEAGCSRTARARSATRYVEANAAALRELGAGRPRLREPRAAGRRRSARRPARRSRVKAHGSELEYSMRGRPELEAWGPGRARGAEGRLRRLGPHPRGGRGGRAVTSTACTRCRRASTSTSSAPQPRDEALAGLLDEARADPPNPGNANERLPGRGERRAARGVPRRRRADRRLLREADREQGRPPAARGARRASTRAR